MASPAPLSLTVVVISIGVDASSEPSLRDLSAVMVCVDLLSLRASLVSQGSPGSSPRAPGRDGMDSCVVSRG